MDKEQVVEMYMHNNFRRYEGEEGYRGLETLCETLGYGQGWMRGRAVEEMFADNPGAVEAVAEFLREWAVANTDWNERLAERLAEDGLLEEQE